MIVSINQPAYLPWLGYFHRIALSDSHIVLDHVQFEKNSFTNRNKVRTPQGWCWLSVPVKTKGKFGQLPIHSIEINPNEKWQSKHWKTIKQCYAKAPYFDEHAPFFETVYEREWIYLSDLCREITQYLLDAFGIHTPLQYSSDIKISGSKDELVLNLCQEMGTDIYLSGPLGRDYLREDMFQEAGIQIQYHDFRHPEYPQLHYQNFEPYMAAIDLLFNSGPHSHEVLMKESNTVQ